MALLFLLTGLELLAQVPGIFEGIEILPHVDAHFFLSPITIARLRLRWKDAAARQ